MDGSKWGVKIEYNREKRMGTAGALSLIKPILKNPFLLSTGIYF